MVDCIVILQVVPLLFNGGGGGGYSDIEIENLISMFLNPYVVRLQ